MLVGFLECKSGLTNNCSIFFCFHSLTFPEWLNNQGSFLKEPSQTTNEEQNCTHAWDTSSEHKLDERLSCEE